MNKKLYDKFESELNSYGMSPQTTKTAMLIVLKAYVEGKREIVEELIKILEVKGEHV